MKHFGNGTKTTMTDGNEYRIIPASNFFLANEEREREKHFFNFISLSEVYKIQYAQKRKEKVRS